MDTSQPFKWRHFQAEIILLRARIACRSHDDLPLGAKLRTRTGEALQISSQGHKRLLARR